jgi:hypothetical protein
MTMVNINCPLLHHTGEGAPYFDPDEGGGWRDGMDEDDAYGQEHF